MIVSSFDGGLNTRRDPSLILASEAVTYENIDNEAVILKSIKDNVIDAQEVSGYFYNYDGTWLSSENERSYVEYADILYFTEEGKTAKRFDGSRIVDLGIAKPVDTPTTAIVAGTGISTSEVTVQYVYTYYNSQDGIESAPSDPSDELVVPINNDVEISNIVASEDLQVDKIRIYRIGDNTSFTLVMTVNNANYTDLLDNITTLDLPGDILDSIDNYPAPEGARYLTEAYGMLFCTVGDKLYFTRIGKPYAWPPSYNIDFTDTLTGILPVPEGLLVFTENLTRIVVGTTVDTFNKLKVTEEQGCILHLSCRFVKNTPVWLSLDGICTYSNGSVSVISKDKLGKVLFNAINTAVLDEQYYICLADGTFMIFDARYNNAYKTVSFDNAIGNILVYDDTLYGRVANNLSYPFTGEDIEFEYLSPVYTEGNHANEKAYNNIYIRYDGTFTIDVYINEVLVKTDEIEGNEIHDLKVPQEKQRGSSIQFGIKGIGKIYEIDYKLLGRQNGR